MNYLVNPFQHLYVTERVGPKEFVNLVSPVIIPHVQELFLPGNVFLLGTQGSGKSTLLALLKAEIRKAYHDQEVAFPLDDGLSKFFSAGINLNTSDALAIGQLPIEKSLEDDYAIFPLYFADFCNYWIINDILEKLIYINDNKAAFNFSVNDQLFDDFATLLAKEDCWFGFLDGVSTLSNLVDKIRWRISQYRFFSQYNIPKLPSAIQKTKTNIGEPISRTVKSLKEIGVIDEDVSVHIRIDEVDRLNRIDSARNEIGKEYRRIINRAISKRDKYVSYKIALRTYAFNNDLKIFRSDLEIENKRDFSILDIDEILRQEENQRTWLFPEFAHDVFYRRLTNSFKEAKCQITDPKELFENIFGKKIPPTKIAKERYAKNSKPERGMVLEPAWPKKWTNYLKELYKENPLSAKLGSAWLRQSAHKDDLKKILPISAYHLGNASNGGKKNEEDSR